MVSANLVITCFSFFVCAFNTEKRAHVVYPKIFDAFMSDWLKFLINIHEKIVALAANQAVRVRVKMNRKLKIFLAL